MLLAICISIEIYSIDMKKETKPENYEMKKHCERSMKVKSICYLLFVKLFELNMMCMYYCMT